MGRFILRMLTITLLWPASAAMTTTRPAAGDEPKRVDFQKIDAGVFDRFDDGDGNLTSDEIGDYPWGRFDTDGDGRVAKSEFIIGRLNDRLDFNAETDLEKAWKLLDWTADGKLSGRELDEGTWLRFDRDGDGAVAKGEFLAARGAAPGVPAAPVPAAPVFVPRGLDSPPATPGSASTSSGAVPAGWKRFRSLGFEFVMPGQTTESDQDGSTHYSYTFPDAHTSYSVMMRDWGKPSEGDAAEHFKIMRDSYAEAIGGNVVEETPISLDGHPGVALVIKNDNGVAVRARAYMVGSRYLRAYGSTDKYSQTTPTEIDQFLSSVGIADDRSGGPGPVPAAPVASTPIASTRASTTPLPSETTGPLPDLSAAATWKTYQEAGFEFVMPAGAKRSDSEESIQYQFITPDERTVYQTMIHDLGAPATAAVAKQKLDYIRDFVVMTTSGKLVDETELELAGSPGREIMIVAAGLTIRHRAYVIGARMIRLFTTAETASTATAAELNRFLTSLKITGRKPATDDDVPPPPGSGRFPPPPRTDDDVPPPPGVTPPPASGRVPPAPRTDDDVPPPPAFGPLPDLTPKGPPAPPAPPTEPSGVPAPPALPAPPAPPGPGF